MSHLYLTLIFKAPFGTHAISQKMTEGQREEFIATIKHILDHRLCWHHNFDITLSDDMKRFKKYGI